MRIGINLLSIKEITGIGVYARDLLSNIRNFDGDDTFFIFTNKKLHDRFYFQSPNFKYITLPVNPDRYLSRIIFEQLISPVYFLKFKFDILFSPSVFNPLLCGCPKVTVLHDAGYLDEGVRGLKPLYLKFVTCAAIKSRYLITVSNFAKEEILKYLKIPRERIKVIYLSEPELPKISMERSKEIIYKFGIENPYLFYIGLIVPHKNIKNMLRAFKTISEESKNLKFVFSGRVVEELIDFWGIVKSLSLESRVIYTGRVTDEEKVALYKNSLAFIFPSTHEGFGLPVLEAQGLGIPVLTSNVTSLPEIGGDSVLYVDPYSVEEIADGMEKLITDRNFSEDLVRKGFENIKRFSGAAEAEKTVEIIRRAYED